MKRQRGFTLLEVMIAAVVVAVLLAIAIPSYQENVKRSRRAEAKTAMYGLAQALERFYSNNNTYTGAALGGATPIYPSNVPATGGAAYYTLSLNITDANNYTITATRAGIQAGDKCGDLTLTAAGVRGATGNSLPVADCWR